MPLQPCGPYCIHLMRTLMAPVPAPLGIVDGEIVMRSNWPEPGVTTPASLKNLSGGGVACAVAGKLTSQTSMLVVSMSDNGILRFIVFLLAVIRHCHSAMCS